jgi:hypothetical protein
MYSQKTEIQINLELYQNMGSIMNIMNGVSKVKEIMNLNFHTLFRLNMLLEILIADFGVKV